MLSGRRSGVNVSGPVLHIVAADRVIEVDVQRRTGRSAHAIAVAPVTLPIAGDCAGARVSLIAPAVLDSRMWGIGGIFFCREAARRDDDSGPGADAAGGIGA